RGVFGACAGAVGVAPAVPSVGQGRRAVFVPADRAEEDRAWRRGALVSWALAPAIATYRQFGLPAYLDGESICLHGQKVASATIASIGECAVIASAFLRRFPTKCIPTPSAEMEEAFRLRLEAQHGWQFDHSWPSEHETPKYAVA